MCADVTSPWLLAQDRTQFKQSQVSQVVYWVYVYHELWILHTTFMLLIIY